MDHEPAGLLHTAEKPAISIGQETGRNINELARVQWFARKKAVADGYLPEEVLNLHKGEDATALPEKLGIAYAQGELKRFFGFNPEVIPVMLGARENGQLVGKAAVDVETKLGRATFHGLEVLPEFQGKKIATRLRNATVKFLRKEHPTIKIVRLGRYKMSSEFARNNFKPDSFFNALREKAQLTEDTDNGVPFEWLTMPIDIYEAEVQNSL